MGWGFHFSPLRRITRSFVRARNTVTKAVSSIAAVTFLKKRNGQRVVVRKDKNIASAIMRKNAVDFIKNAGSRTTGQLSYLLTVYEPYLYGDEVQWVKDEIMYRKQDAAAAAKAAQVAAQKRHAAQVAAQKRHAAQVAAQKRHAAQVAAQKRHAAQVAAQKRHAAQVAAQKRHAAQVAAQKRHAAQVAAQKRHAAQVAAQKRHAAQVQAHSVTQHQAVAKPQTSMTAVLASAGVGFVAGGPLGAAVGAAVGAMVKK